MLQNVTDSIGFFQRVGKCIRLANGEYTISEKETLDELLWAYFPGSEIILEPSGSWDSLELEFPK
jgi:hypothetical protein